MFLIQKGTVAIRKMKGNGFVDLAKIYPNEVIGELSFFDRAPRSASAIALTEVEVMEIAFDSLDKTFKTVPPYFRSILTCVADRMRKANETIRRLQKNLVTEKEGVVNHAGSAPDDDDNLNTAAILAAVGDAADAPAKPAGSPDASDGEGGEPTGSGAV